MQIKLPFNFQESQFAVTGIKEHAVKSHSAVRFSQNGLRCRIIGFYMVKNKKFELAYFWVDEEFI